MDAFYLCVCVSLQITGFRSYVDLYVKDKVDEMGVALKVVNEKVNDRWEVCLTLSEKGFQQIGFVNCIATTKVLGTHTEDYWEHTLKTTGNTH